MVGDAREAAELFQLIDKAPRVALDIGVDRAGGYHTAILTLGLWPTPTALQTPPSSISRRAPTAPPRSAGARGRRRHLQRLGGPTGPSCCPSPRCGATGATSWTRPRTRTRASSTSSRTSTCPSASTTTSGLTSTSATTWEAG